MEQRLGPQWSSEQTAQRRHGSASQPTNAMGREAHPASDSSSTTRCATVAHTWHTDSDASHRPFASLRHHCERPVDQSVRVPFRHLRRCRMGTTRRAQAMINNLFA